MARRPKWEEEVAPPGRPGFWLRLRYHVLIVLALLVILYGAGQILGRTAGFRDLVSQRLESQLGLPVKIERSRVNWRFDLTLENLVTEGTKRRDSPGLRAKRIHLAWSPSSWWRGGLGLRALELDRCVVVFGRTQDGTWVPREFQPLSEVLGKWLEFDLSPSTNPSAPSVQGASVSTAPNEAHRASWRDRLSASGVQFRLTQGEVSWWDGTAAPRATVQGVGLQVTPVSLPDRPLTHLKLTVDQAVSQQGENVRNLRVEVLDTGTQQFILGFEAERQQGGVGQLNPRP